ncbi:MAG: DUF4388 domain-containing protein [Sandaracinaceae bacterium]|nr:DUF4388 domain-containing protein [Sandaracinaceae bacterium]
MAKKNLLLVDADPRSLRVLEVSLRKVGYSVTTASEASTALRFIDDARPDLIVSDTRLDGMDGFDFVREIKKRDDAKDIPFIFLSSDMSVESKVRGLELGISDYLNKPIYIKEIVTRVNLLLSRQQHESLAPAGQSGKTKFTGALSDLGLVDLLQTIDLGRKSGVLTMSNGPMNGTIYFSEGRVIDAEVGTLRGENAVYRSLLWSDGSFEIDFRPVRREDRIQNSTQAILMEGMRRVDEWSSLLEQIPSLHTVCEVVEEEFYARLADIPDEMNDVLKHVDGKRSLTEVVASVDGDDLAVLASISKLYFDGLIKPSASQLSSSGLVESAMETPSAGHLAERSTDSDRDSADALPVRTGDTVPFRATAQPTQPIDTVEEKTLKGVGIPFATAASLVPPAAVVRVGDVQDSLQAAQPDSKKETSENDSPDESDSSETDSEDPMSKKGKRKKQASMAPEALSQGSLENNIIRFPQKSAHVVTQGQVAVGDNVSSSPVEAPRSEPPPSQRPSGIESTGKKNKKKRREESDSDTSQITQKRKPEDDADAAKTEVTKVDATNADAKKEDDGTPKEVTTGSHAAIITGEHKAMADEFFRSEAYNAAQNIAPPETWDDLDDTEVLPHQRRGLYATIAIGLAAAAVIIGIYGYNHWVMPEAETLGQHATTELPQPIAAGSTAATAAATPTPAEAPAAAAPVAAASTATAPEAAAVTPTTAAPTAATPVEPIAAAPAAAAPAAPVAGDYAAALAAAKRARGRRQVDGYLAAIAINPAGSEALSGLGFIYLNRGDNRQAADLAARAVAADPTNSEGWITLGAARQGLHDVTGAREAYRACVERGTGRYVNDCRQMSR